MKYFHVLNFRCRVSLPKNFWQWIFQNLDTIRRCVSCFNSHCYQRRVCWLDRLAWQWSELWTQAESSGGSQTVKLAKKRSMTRNRITARQTRRRWIKSVTDDIEHINSELHVFKKMLARRLTHMPTSNSSIIQYTHSSTKIVMSKSHFGFVSFTTRRVPLVHQNKWKFTS